MPYVEGFVAAVPTANREEYREHAKAAVAYFKKLGATGDSEMGQVIGEYTLELRNENAHGLIRGLAT